MFDLIVFSSVWPKGLFLCKKLSEQGKKVCYVDLKQEVLAPLGLFIQESDDEERLFLESLGFLAKQEEGFCLLSPEGHWPFQEIDWQNVSSSLFQKAKDKGYGDFKDYWLASLSRNLMSRIFEGNHSFLLEEGLDFFVDYFLYEPSLKKKNEFQAENPQISYLETSLEDLKITLKKLQASVSIGDKNLESHKFLWLAEERDFLNLCSSERAISPDWVWKSFSFEAHLGDYTNIIPSHFVSLKDLSLPWTHDNLLSVFHRDSYWDVWFKQAYAREDADLLEIISVHLNTIFNQAVTFKVLDKKQKSSFCIYGKDKLQQKGLRLKNVIIPNLSESVQGDFLSQLRYEKQLLEQRVV